MKISLEQPEIEQAIAHYIETKFFSLKNKHLEIEFLSGRNPPTVTANINILDTGEKLDINSAPPAPVTAKVPFSLDQDDLPFKS